MSLLLFAAFLFVRQAASAEPKPLTGWSHAPNLRGTWDIIVSCVLTLTICVWSALHLNVPVEDSRLRQRNARRVRWILLGIFAPELVVSTAFAQFLTARWLLREIRKDVKFRAEKDPATGENHVNPEWSSEQQCREWSITQCYFAVMGGIRIETGDCIEGSPRLSLTAEGVRMLSFLGRLPDIPEHQISDKSKADGLAKFLVILQAGWMILQTLARVQQGLTVTLLEINTMGHVTCAFALYALWWSKPLDIKDPTVVRREEWMDPFVAFFYMCSPISWYEDDYISEMRCLDYTPKSQRGEPKTPVVVDGEQPKLEVQDHKPHKTHFSVGSIGARDPMKFIGPLEKFHAGGDTKATLDRDVSYVIHAPASFDVAREHKVFFELSEADFGLQHSKFYCRRALKDCEKHDELSPSAIKRWRLANHLVDDLWDECEKRPEFREFYFTISSLGNFVGEVVYIADHITNFPGLSYLGSVNVHRDSLKAVLAFAGTAYGGLHLSAWKDYFPTRAERWLWITCALATGASGVILALFFLATQKVRAFENLEHFIRNNRRVQWAGASIVAPLFIVARVYIVVEAFISLRRAPEDIYATPEWSNYFPHL